MGFKIDDEEIMLIESYKEKYDYIYMTDMTETCGIQFVWREVTRREFKKLMEYFPDPYDREEQLCKICIIEPGDFDFTECDAGIPYILATQILEESGFSSTGEKVNRLLLQGRENMQSFESRADAIITEAFPYITLEEIQDWSTEKTTKYYAIAEYKLSHYRGVSFEEQEQGTVLSDGTVLRGDAKDFPELRGV